MSKENGKHKGMANLIPFKAGADWNGNPGGRPKGFRRLLRKLMTKRALRSTNPGWPDSRAGSC